MFPEVVCRVKIGDLQAGLYLCHGLIREPKLLTPSLLVLSSLYSLEICAANVQVKEDFRHQISPSI